MNTVSDENRRSEAWPLFDDEMVDAASRVLRSGRVNYWTGDEGITFEREFAEFVGVRHAIALANGTVALELALRALGIGPDDEVIVPSRTFIATASAVAAVGARPVFADIDRDSQNLTVESVAPRIGSSTRAIIAVHLAGWPCAMAEIMDLASRHGLYVIEDCAQAHGAEIDGKRVGSLGDIAAFSFCQDKIMTTGGEGGMLTTNNERLHDSAWRYKDHGKPRSIRESLRPAGSAFRWVHESLGSNYRLSEVQAAIGRVQLRRLPSWLYTRQRFADLLTEACRGSALLRTPRPASEIRHANYKFYTFLRPEHLAPGWSRGRILQELAACGVSCSVGTCSEVYREEAFPNDLRPASRLPVASELGETSLMFLVHPTLEERTVKQAADAIATVAERACKIGVIPSAA